MVQRIVELAAARGLSLKGLERQVGLHNLYRWDENTPSVDKVQKVADFLGVSVDYILGREQVPDSYDEIRDELDRLRMDPDLRVLLSASAGLTHEDLEIVIAMAKRMKGDS